MKRLLTLFVFYVLTLTASAQAVQHGVVLSWNQSTSPTTSNNVYSSLTTGGPYIKIYSSPSPITAYTVPLTIANSGIKTYFVVTAVTAGGIETGYSNEISATFLVLGASPTGLTEVSQ